MQKLPKRTFLLNGLLLTFLLLLGCSDDSGPSGGSTTNTETAEEVPADAPVVIETLEEVPEQEPVTKTEDVPEDVEETPAGPPTVEILNDRFGTGQITISVGDTLVWKNSRTGSGSLTGAMILGVRNCADVRSAVFKPGNSFSWTFTEPETCTLVDGIKTTMIPMTVIIE